MHINTAAWGFGALFMLEGRLLWRVVLRDQIHLGATASSAGSIVGWALIAYAVGQYPPVGLLSGQPFDELPAYGLTPCPLTLTTLGCLLLVDAPPQRRLLPIPLLWSFVGGSAALILAMPQDWALLAGGLAGSLRLIGCERWWRGRPVRPHTETSAGPVPASDTDGAGAAGH